jgi:nucleotide-binding universal stress UspA family protein
VVGVDGSPTADAALRWAIRHAAREGGTVQAVAVRHLSTALPAASLAAQPHGRTPVTTHATLLERLHATVDEARAEVTHPPSVVEVTPTGDPAQELVRSAEDADLLVLGSHGHGPLAEMLVGNVTSACLRHARCPVVVINPGTAERVTGESG